MFAKKKKVENSTVWKYLFPVLCHSIVVAVRWQVLYYYYYTMTWESVTLYDFYEIWHSSRGQPQLPTQ